MPCSSSHSKEIRIFVCLLRFFFLCFFKMLMKNFSSRISFLLFSLATYNFSFILDELNGNNNFEMLIALVFVVKWRGKEQKKSRENENQALYTFYFYRRLKKIFQLFFCIFFYYGMRFCHPYSNSYTKAKPANHKKWE